MPVINQKAITPKTGSTYPAPFDTPCIARSNLKLGDAGGLTQFGANMVTLSPGAWSSQRHYHTAEDEFVYIISGRPTFIDDNGRRILTPGDCTAHPAGDGNGHHMINETEHDVLYLVIGSRRSEIDSGIYPDVDLHIPANGTADRVYKNKKGEAY